MNKANSTQPPPHEHVYVQYQKGAPARCFKCFFWEEKQRRNVRVFATDPANRQRTRDGHKRRKAVRS
jgi:hypothetical protein